MVSVVLVSGLYEEGIGKVGLVGEESGDEWESQECGMQRIEAVPW